MGSVIVWGRRPPPIGGVSVSFDEYSRSADRPENVFILELDRPLSSTLRLVRSIAKPVIHIVSVSRLKRLIPLRAMAAQPRHEVVPYLRRGDLLSGPTYPAMLKPFREVWVTNSALANLALEAGARQCWLVTPRLSYMVTDKPPSQRATDRGSGNRPLIFGTACLSGLPAYNPRLTVEVVRRLRDVSNLNHRLIILHYGAATKDAKILSNELSTLDWVEQVHGLAPAKVPGVLRALDVLLRLSSTDGDSNIIHQALANGCRVIASNVVPRPRGVELCELDRDSAVAAIRHGGELSTAETPEAFDRAVMRLSRFVEGWT